MLTRILLAAGMIFAAGGAQAASPGETLAAAQKIDPQIFSQGDDPYPDHHVSFAGAVTGLPDVTYAIVQRYRPLKLDLYLPPPSFKGPRPTVLFIHGGGWVGGGPRLSGAFDNWPNVLAAMSARGYVIASVSYRFTGEGPAPVAIQDVKSAIRWLRLNADRYGVDKRRIMTWGGSAGGQLAALAATSCGIQGLEPPRNDSDSPNVKGERQTAGPAPLRVESDCVQGAVIWYGVFDFTSVSGAAQVRSYLGCGRDPCSHAALAEASPVTYLGEKTPPMLLIAGSDDHTVPPQQSRDFHAAMQAKRLKSELLILPGVDHSFIGKTPEATRAATTRALARTVDFIDSVIGDTASH